MNTFTKHLLLLMKTIKQAISNHLPLFLMIDDIQISRPKRVNQYTPIYV